MIGPLQNAIRLQAMRAMSGQADTRVGLVTNFDPNIWAVRVALQPDGFLSGWLPVASPWIGNGWGLFAAPGLGDMVAVEFFGGDLEAGFVQGRMFNDLDRPLPVPAGELWIVHASGAFFKLLNSGAATLNDGHGASVTLNGNGTISSAGTWNHAGTFTATTDVIGGGKSLANHKHTGVQTGGGVSGPPQ